MKFPPLNDPSWKEFAEQHRQFLNARPNYEKHMEERVRFFAELLEQGSIETPEGHEQPRNSVPATDELRPKLAERRIIELRHQQRSRRASSGRLHIRAAGVADSFPPEEKLPEDWFPGEEVYLHFSNEAGPWTVRRSGTPVELILQFWSIDEKPIGQALVVGRYSKEIPVTSPSELSRIDISIKHGVEDA